MGTTQNNPQVESSGPAVAKMLSHEELSELPGKEMLWKRTVSSKTYDLGGGIIRLFCIRSLSISGTPGGNGKRSSIP